MALSKQDFEAVADILSEHEPVQGEAVDIQHRDMIGAFADYFETTNPRFDRRRFLKACGVG